MARVVKWKKLSDDRAQSEQGHIALKYFDGAYYAMFSPSGYYLGNIMHWDDKDGFLASPCFQEPQVQELLI